MHLPWLCRRAKRLKKLVKLITVDIIQSAVNSFSLKSWLLLAVLLVAHIVCFVVLVQQVDSQHRWEACASRQS
jgi:hypothetical protein